MDVKKSSKANLEKERITYFLVGMVVALSALFVALEWQSDDYLSPDWEGFNRVYIEEELIGFEQLTPDEMEETPITEPKVVPEQPAVIREDFEVVEEIAEEVPVPTDSVPAMAEVPEEEESPLPQLTDEEIQEMVHIRAEVMPMYPGGYNKLTAFLFNNIEYPSLAIKQRIQGQVWFSFIVNKDGSVSDIKCEQGVYFALDDEAERVLRLMPAWEPGTIDGNRVRVKVYLPINFRL